VLGYAEAESYQLDSAFHGAIARRYCNRIANSQFALQGHTHTLASNEGPHHLHGGPEGFSRRVWQVGPQTDQTLQLNLRSPSGDQGYPGELDVTLNYTLDDDGALCIDWVASASADTVVSITSHAYYNLAGSGDILNHWLRIPAAHYTPVDHELIPTGEIRNHAGICLEPQYYPDSPNRPHFPSPVLRSGDIMRHRMRYQVSQVDARALLSGENLERDQCRLH
jgi:aldose 1-epimerase